MKTEEKKLITQTEWNINRDKMASDRRNTETHCHYTGLPSVESYDKDFPVNQELLEKYHELTRGLH
jgi:hypothetical protein